MPQEIKWYDVRRDRPCTICGRPNWCRFSEKSLRCNRVPSDRPAKGGYGWLHKPDAAAVWVPPPPEIPKPSIDAEAYLRALPPDRDRMIRLGETLGVGTLALSRLRCRWDAAKNAWAFPMADEAGKAIGIRLRASSGKKWAVTGSRAGLFIPTGLGGGDLMIVEGPTDTAALLSLGFDAIGRPSCSGGVDLIIAFLKSRPRRKVVIVGDNDTDKPLPDGSTFNPGKDGARILANSIKFLALGPPKIVYPVGVKDSRAWLNAGATREDFERIINE